ADLADESEDGLRGAARLAGRMGVVAPRGALSPRRSTSARLASAFTIGHRRDHVVRVRSARVDTRHAARAPGPELTAPARLSRRTPGPEARLRGREKRPEARGRRAAAR